MRKLLLTLPLACLAGACATSEQRFAQEVATLEGLTCPNLEAEMILAETQTRVEAIRAVQIAQGCELKPLPPQRVAKKQRNVEPEHWRYERRAAGADRARNALDRQ